MAYNARFEIVHTLCIIRKYVDCVQFRKFKSSEGTYQRKGDDPFMNEIDGDKDEI